MKRNAEKEAYWREIVKRQARSGLPVRSFCSERDLSEPSFYWWRKKLAERGQGKVGTNSRSSRNGAASSETCQAFIPLTVTDSGHSLEIVHPLGYRVRVTGEVNARSLKQVFDALDGRGEE